jgi:DNA (cytosine-5)-methyltransferase 1
MMRTKPKALDLFCCAGGAAKGIQRAGFHVTGVDIEPQPRYCGNVFVQADALKFPIDWTRRPGDFDFIWASPPCQRFSDLARRNGNADDWPDLIEPIRKRLRNWATYTGGRYVIENVEGAPLSETVMLCGTMFLGLRVLRHRLFEANFPIEPPPHGKHPKVHTFDKRKSHFGKTNEMVDFVQVTGGGNCTLAAASDAMGIDWMTKNEINEAIPPAYAEHIGRAALAHITQTGRDNSPHRRPA